jgi:dTDP-4-amino-4,6-dideoxygalactose transaminase
MHKIKIHDLKRKSDFVRQTLQKAFDDVLDEANYLRGSYIKQFESQWAEYCGAEDCTALTSGTDALHIAGLVAGLKAGDEIIMPAHTYIASPEPFAHIGCTIKWVDNKLSDYLIDEDQIEKLITDKTKAIVYVDMLGQTPDIEKILSIAKKHNLITIEDAAPASGARYKNKVTGGFADITAFSFGPVKNLGAIGGSGCITGSKKYCDLAKQLSFHGQMPGSGRDTFLKLGYNRKPHNLQYAFLLAKLPHLETFIEKQRSLAFRYNTELKDIVNHVPEQAPDRYHTYHLYSILVDKRDELQDYLRKQNIECLRHYTKPMFDYEFLSGKNISTPITDRIIKETISIPCHAFLTQEEQDYVIEHIKKFYE